MRHIYRNLLLICVMALLGACGQAQVIPTVIVLPTAPPTATAAPTFTPQAVTNETLEQARPALVRIVNAAVDSPALNVFAGFSAIATNLGYTQFTEPTSFDAGKYTVKVQSSGSAPNDKSLLESDLTFPSGESIMILVTGNGSQLALTVLPDKNEALKNTESIIHVINGLSDSGAVALKNGSTDLATRVNVGQTVLSPIVTAGKSDLTFQIGDKTLDYPVDLKAQANTTLIVAGKAATPSIIQFDMAAPKRISVRALNASAEINSVDVFLDDQPLNSAVEYGRPTERQNFASGQYTARFYAAGADRTKVEPLTGQVVSLTDGDNFDIILLGSASDLSVLAFPENLSPTASGNTRIAFLNTLPNLSEVDVQATTTAMPGIPTLFYGQAPSVMEVQAGSYSFIMGAPNSQNIRTTIERAENVQLETGNSYLYLVTGRLDSPPIVLSDKVDTTSTPSDSSGTPSANVRFINAVEGQSFDFGVNGAVALTELKYGEGSTLTPITDQSVTITVNSSGQTTPLGQQDTTFAAGSSYTIVAYQAAGGAVGLLVINDDNLIFDGSSPHVRLINVSSNENSSLGLAFSSPNAKPIPTDAPVVAPEATADGNVPDVVYTLPYGVQKLVNNVGAGSASSVILMPVGDFALDIIESVANKMVVNIPKVTMSEDIHIDVIAYEDPNSGNVSVFAVTYPKPQA
ncbi:MAG: DUF4397 domain-containing protein [Chloroflexota bacterium]